MTKKKRIVIIIGIVILLAAGTIAALQLFGTTKDKVAPVAAPQKHTSPSKTTAPNQLVFAAMGDQLAHDSVVAQAKTGSTYDFAPYFTAIRPLYKNADVVFCNPETLMAGQQLGISGYPTFNAPNEFARDLVMGLAVT